jgi:hypothetical protein
MAYRRKALSTSGPCSDPLFHDNPYILMVGPSSRWRHPSPQAESDSAILVPKLPQRIVPTSTNAANCVTATKGIATTKMSGTDDSTAGVSKPQHRHHQHHYPSEQRQHPQRPSFVPVLALDRVTIVVEKFKLSFFTIVCRRFDDSRTLER